jgi:hypothetical protein
MKILSSLLSVAVALQVSVPAFAQSAEQDVKGAQAVPGTSTVPLNPFPEVSVLPANPPTNSTPATEAQPQVVKFVYLEHSSYDLSAVQKQISHIDTAIQIFQAIQSKPALITGVVLSGLVAFGGLAMVGQSEVSILNSSVAQQESRLPSLLRYPGRVAHWMSDTGLGFLNLEGKTSRIGGVVYMLEGAAAGTGWYYFSAKYAPQHIAMLQAQRDILFSVENNLRLEQNAPK